MLTIKVGGSITSEGAINALAELFSIHGVPARLRCDNRHEFTSTAIKKWLTTVGVEILYIEPGSPRRTASARVSMADDETSTCIKQTCSTKTTPE